MDTLQDAYRDDDDEEEQQQTPTHQPDPNENESKTTVPDPNPSSEPPSEQTPKIPAPTTEQQPESMAVEPVTIKPELEPEADPMTVEMTENPDPESEPGAQSEPLGSEEVSTDSISEDEPNPENSDRKAPINNEEEDQNPSPAKKQKSLSQLDPSSEQQQEEAQTPTLTPTTTNNKTPTTTKKSSKKKAKWNNVWTKPTSRKGKKKSKNNNNNNNNNNSNNTTPKPEETVLVTPIPRFPDRNDDSPDSRICLSKVYKAEKVELSEDRMSAGSCKGYRMVRATRGVSEGAWYYEIKLVHLGETGHTRLGWSTEKGDLQAPVGYDGNSFGYRDVDGSKVHKALRENYGEEGYKEGDVIGFYINLPDGNAYTPKLPHLVWYKGQKYVCAPDPKEDPPKIVPGSEISFFKNGICQGVAFKDLYGGRYYPAASMYTLPNQPNCVVKFNFGPDFEYFPTEFEGRALPRPMIEVPYHGFDNRVENGVVNEAKE